MNEFKLTDLCLQRVVNGEADKNTPLGLQVEVVETSTWRGGTASLVVHIVDSVGERLASLNKIEINKGCHLTIVDVMSAFNIRIFHTETSK